MNENENMEISDQQPKISRVKYEISGPKISAAQQKELNNLVNEISESTSIVVNLWQRDIEKKERLLKEEKENAQMLLTVEAENIQIKLKRWCICGEKATFMDDDQHFYCSIKCQDALNASIKCKNK